MTSDSPRSGLFDATSLFLLVTLGLVLLVVLKGPPTVRPPLETSPIHSGTSDPDYHPKIKEASKVGRQRLERMQVAEGFEGELFAEEPLLANPVAFWVDERNRVFVAETFRQATKGVPDNREHRHWIPQDLAARTLEDRRAMYLRHEPEESKEWATEHDRVRLVLDEDRDGRADRATVYADGFNDLLDGTGAGVLWRDGRLYYTCIPNLWALDDRNDDGVCEEREALATGFGIRVALRGHDLHGLILGPDRKLYFSIGDRGYNITTREGKHLFDPGSGAVFRCELDGSGLEVFARGLRNPQELAFDDFGDLFTGDNNADGGDKARIVAVVEGGQTAWRMNFQYMDKRGPWMRERWCEPQHEGQAAFLIPPVGTLGAGPSGLFFNPGTQLPSRLERSFFLCDFRGGANNSGVRNFRCDHKGAGFALVDQGWFVRRVLATDVAIGIDGRVWVSDFGHGWVGEGTGRLYTFEHAAAQRPAARETTRLLREGFAQRELHELTRLLEHPDRRVRLEAQWAIADRGAWAVPAFERVATRGLTLLSRIHALWGLGQVAKGDPRALQVVARIAAAATDELKGQALRVLGERGHRDSVPLLIASLADPHPRVRFRAAMALGKLPSPDALPALAKLLEENADRDVYLRHAAVMALRAIAIGGDEQLEGLAAHPSAAVRMGVLLAWRRTRSERIARFLDDGEARLRREAARAIYDVEIDALLPELARRLVPGTDRDLAWCWRLVGANDRNSDAESAKRLALWAASEGAEDFARGEALEALLQWEKAPETERVLNRHRPRAPRRKRDARAALQQALPGLLKVREPRAERLVLRCVARHGFKEALEAVRARLADADADDRVRVEALNGLQALGDPEFEAAVTRALASNSPRLRARAVKFIPGFGSERGLPILRQALEGAAQERQAAVRGLIAAGWPEGDALLRSLAESLDPSRPLDIALELLEAIDKRGWKKLRTRWDEGTKGKRGVEAHLASLLGGDEREGERVFEKNGASCRRCHSLEGEKSELAGPPLSDLAARRSRREILESIVDPNATIAEGYAMVLVETKDGELLDGRILNEDATTLQMEVQSEEGPRSLRLAKADIAARKASQSAMPQDVIKHLNAHNLRDLVAFLASLRKR